MSASTPTGIPSLGTRIRRLNMFDNLISGIGRCSSTARATRRCSGVQSPDGWSAWSTIGNGSSACVTVAPANCQMVFASNSDDYVNAVRPNGPFDVIIIDGQSRLACAPVAVEALRPGGLIILDNSDWFPRTSEVLRARNLIEVDMAGFGPINDYTSTTSFYFHRQFAALPRSDRQPAPGIGSRPNSFDEAWWHPG